MLESWHVVLRCCPRLLLIGGAITYSALAPALGLGEITLHSALNQPLRADIALVDATGLDQAGLSVSLATTDEFARAGVERVFFLNDLTFTPITRGNRSLIRVSSVKAVKEPFLNFLVQLHQPNGRVLREYTLLIDPPGSPEIVPISDEPVPDSQNSAFANVSAAAVPSNVAKQSAPAPKVDQPADASVTDPVAEQLATSVLQNQRLQSTIDELNTQLQAKDELIAGEKTQVVELQTRLSELQQVPVVAPAPAAAAPVVVEEPETSRWPLISAVLALAGLVLLGLFVRRRRQQADVLPETLPVSPSRHEPLLTQAPMLKPAADHADDTPAGDVLEGVGICLAYGRFCEAAGLLREALAKEPLRADLAVQLLDVLGKQGDLPGYELQENHLRDAGVDEQSLRDMRGHHPKLNSSAPIVPAAVIAPPLPVAPATEQVDQFRLNLGDLSMDSNWDLINPFENTASPVKPATASSPEDPAFSSNLFVLPDVLEVSEDSMRGEPELEWVEMPDSPARHDQFLAEFSDCGPSPGLEPSSLEPNNPAKLEQAHTSIDNGIR